MEFAADEAKPATGGEVTCASTIAPSARVGWITPSRCGSLATPTWIKRVVFDIKPHLSDQDELDLHAETHRGQAAHGLVG
jgi:hypothetical protein